LAPARWVVRRSHSPGSCSSLDPLPDPQLASTHAAAHWDIAWAGFDVALAVLLLGSPSPPGGGLHGSKGGAATAAAALLVVDAWFDILTSSTKRREDRGDRRGVLAELPLAAVAS